MKKIIFLVPILCLSVLAFSQSSGNQVHGNRYASPAADNWTTLYLSDSTFLIEASVMMQRPADYFVAVFGLAQECTGVEDGNKEISRRIDSFKKRLKGLGIADADVAVDVTAQERIYEYNKIAGSVVEEQLKGFELKRNVMVRYKEEALLERLMVEASKDSIYDLVKVDYIVEDVQAVYEQLFAEAEAIIAKKRQRYVSLTGVKLKPSAMIYAENFSAALPNDRYEEYTAFSSGSWSAAYNSGLSRKEARKMTTYYYEGVSYTGFDKVLNMKQLSPSVQFILAMKIRYEIVR